jgi:hypothetical protein
VADEFLGALVRCPQCRTTFVVEPDHGRPGPVGAPAAGEPPPPSRGDDEGKTYDWLRRPPDSASPRDWARVRTGISFLVGALVVSILSFVALLAALVVGGGTLINAMARVNAGNQLEGKDAAGLLVVLLLLFSFAFILLVGYALSVTGHIFCVFAPPSHGARVLAIIALVLSSLSVLSCCGGGLMSVPHAHASSRQLEGGGNDAGGGRSPGGLQYLFDMAEKIVFLFFLRSVALSVRANGLASSIVYQLIATGVGIVLSIGLVCGGVALGAMMILQKLNGPDPAAAWQTAPTGYIVAWLAMAGLYVVVWTVLLLWYVVTLFQVRSALTGYLNSRD